MLRWAPAVGLTAQAALLAALEVTVGLSALGWVVGLTCGVVTNAVVAREQARNRTRRPQPADLVTLVRATLVGGVAALTADSFLQQPAVAVLVGLTVAALVLDAVDGWVARRTRTASLFGARFDGEVDAFLILVLSLYVARSFGEWVLAIGAARYVFALVGWGLPWLRRQLPPRDWRRVVAAVQGIVLTLAAAEVLPRSLTYAALAVALGLLAESFGRDVWWLWRARSDGSAEPAEPAEHAGTDASPTPVSPEEGPGVAEEPRAPGPRRRRHAVVAVVTDGLALLVVWFALVAPDQTYRLTPSAFLRIPVEALALAGLALVLPGRGRRVVAAVVGVVLGMLTILKVLNMGFFAMLDRPFNLVTDRGYLSPTVHLVKDMFGQVGATFALIAAAAAALAVLVCMPLSVARLSGLVARHRRGSLRAVTGLGVIWVACALIGLQVGPGEPIASIDSSRAAVGQLRAIANGVHDEQRFEAAAAVDRFDQATSHDVLAGLRGKDVLVVFVESYGRSAIQGLPSSPRVRALLDTGTRRLHASGYSSRSAFLTSPTFGGLSWLAHSTLESGLRVDNQPRYDDLLSGNRLTLVRAFKRGGWHTVAALPSTSGGWAAGKRFYRIDKVLDRRDFDYRGPRFGFSRMPDQYALSVLGRQELTKRNHTPVMAQVELASSHAPWAPIPRMLAWNRLGNGSVYDRVHSQARSGEELLKHPENIRGAYVDSIVYTLRSLISFVQRYGDDDSVLVVLGDHQPATVVTGQGASHDVPVTVIAHDPTVMDKISGWGWQHGMRPDSRAPVWPMDAFRDRFLSAFSPPQPQDPSTPSSPPQQ